ncbi:hypothetical protein [Nocardioides aurantiacus]|uniref:hypothetical protein n=1 Tax=Nocardioides aurantiacus TaxID=86796 RepID=UPI001FEA27E7|nr:hypothetical protein [Nocardioides aurantiacus]
MADQPLARQLVWLVDRLRPVRHPIAAVHDRVARSPGIARWHAGFHAQVEALFEQQLALAVPGARRDAEVAVVTFAIEGAVTHDLEGRETAALCHLLADRLTVL